MLATNSGEYSSSPIILGIAGAFIVSALGGWFSLNNKTYTRTVDETDTSTLLAIASPKSTATPVDVDTELRKAQLSADAGLLVSPQRQNALYFYGRVLAADPEHQVAGAELDAVLASISLLVDDHLAANEYDEAYGLALSAAQLMPDHRLVEAIRSDLSEHATALVKWATNRARDGNDPDAMATLSLLEGLPGLSTEFVAAAQRAVFEAQESRRAAERQRLDAERLASEQIDLDWQQRVRDEIAAGNLLTPRGFSARDFLEERGADAEQKDLLIDELQAALIVATRDRLKSGKPAEAEEFLIAAGEIGADDDAIAELRAEVEQTLIEQESTAIVSLAEFSRLNTVPAKYPQRASERNIGGWVDVAFTVTSTGQTSEIDVLRAEPANVFEDSAIKAVEQWTFIPRQFRGQPIDQRTAARLVFKIE